MMKYIAQTRRNLLRASLLLALVAPACAPTPPIEMSGDTTEVLRDPRALSAVQAAYHERIRLGLGSPFRILEIAAHDARVPNDAREELLRSLFERIADGDMYHTGLTLPAAHYRVIESALRSADDPRVAELAINLAYEIATTEKSVTPELQYAASSTAALMRDRALAQRDAEHVRTVARQHRQAPHTLVPALRATRELRVEQPLQLEMSAAAEEEASRLAMMLVGGVRQAARTQSITTEPAGKAGELTSDVAQTILALPQHHPPQAALVVAMRAAQLPFSAQNEERFVAELALQDKGGSLAAQRAAIALRPFAQEKIFSPLAPQLTAPERLTKSGVRVTFDADVPERWHDYYLFVLDQALADMTRAAPGLNLKGLTIAVGDVAPSANHLAYHDPRTRTIRWAPATGSGSLAHEIGHDLDWQIARRAYGRTGYASDVATDVAAMLLLTRADTAPERPRETFARHLDWVTASALAAQGRMNGHLSSVQHDWLPGHGSARPPIANSRSAKALAGMAVRGGRLDEKGRESVEQAVLALSLPKSVHAVRQVRHQTQEVVGPRVSGLSGPPLAATSAYVNLLGHSAGFTPTPLPAAALTQWWQR